jgi:tetratricopeptide (TPR) repeat protein
MESFPDQREEEGKEWLSRLEDMLANRQSHYLDQEAYEYGVRHFLHANKPSKALAISDLALRQYPYASDMLLLRAQALLGADKAEDALAVIAQVETLMTHDFELVLAKAGALSRLARHAEAITLLKEKDYMVDDQEHYHFVLAHTYQDWDKMDAAIKHYKKVLDLNPKHEDALFELGWCLDAGGRLAEAVDIYQKTLDFDPFAAQIWYNLALVYIRLGKNADAAHAADYAVTLQDDYPAAWFALGNAHMNLDNPAEAAQAYEKAVAQDPTAEIHVCLGASYEQQEQYDKAIANYRLALKLDKEYDDAWYGIGICLLEQQKYFESIHFFTKAIELSPEDDAFWLGLASAEYETGNLVSALEAYEQACNLNPANPDLWMDWSYIYYDMGDYERAISLITSGLEESPANADLHYRACCYMLAAGYLAEAVKFLEMGLQLDYDAHDHLYDFFPDLEQQKGIWRIIEAHKRRNGLA